MPRQTNTSPHKPNTLAVLLINFVVPIIILSRFSGEDRLGPTGGLIAALALPIGYELYNLVTKRKVGWVSIAAIGGILLTGMVSLLGLSENWLAIRRSAIYFISALIIFGSALMNRSVITYLLRQVVNLDLARERAGAARNTQKINRLINGGTYAVAAVVAASGILSYALTKHTINAPANSTLFNEQLASLRVQSIFAVTLPLLIGLVIILTYLITQIEKLSGLSSEELMHKKPQAK